MKTLYIIRHAKSSWEFDLEDHKRPLNKRGFRDAELIGKKLKTQVKSIDKIISSDANRARTTADIVVSLLEIPNKNIVLEPKLYDFGGSQVMEVIRSTGNTIDSLLLFGHNHALTDIVNRYGDKYIDNLPTAGMVMIQFDTDDWRQIDVGNTLLMIFPKQLR